MSLSGERKGVSGEVRGRKNETISNAEKGCLGDCRRPTERKSRRAMRLSPGAGNNRGGENKERGEKRTTERT